MKNWTLYLFIFFILIVAAITGRLINSHFIFQSILTQTKKDTQTLLGNFNKSFDPKKKTIVVFGTSSSLYSFKSSTYFPQNQSYVDLLPKKYNMINLSNHDFFSYDQFESVLSLVTSQLPNIDYVILENLRFMAPKSKLFDDWDYMISAFKSCQDLSNNSYIKMRCDFIWNHLNDSFKLRDYPFNACIKKYSPNLTLSFFQNPHERIDSISNAFNCHFSQSSDLEMKMYILEKFRFGFLMDLQTVLRQGRVDLKRLDPLVYRESYYNLDQVLLNNYLNVLSRRFPSISFIVIPSSAKLLNDLSRISAFEQNKKMHFLEVNSFLEKYMKDNHLDFVDIFPDGSHSKFWVHEYLASQITLKYLQ